METMNAAMAMATEEALLVSVAEGGPPTVRFWRWNPSAVTLGRFQDAELEVDLEFCQQEGIQVVRRMSGGGAVYHQSGGEFVYSITAPEQLFPRDVVGAFAEVLGAVMWGLRSLGLDPWIKDGNNLLVGDRKVSGNSQRRSLGVLQVHGTMLFEVDEGRMFTALRARPGMDTGRATPSRHHAVVGLSSLCDVAFDDAFAAVRDALLEANPYQLGSLSGAETAKAEELVTSKYSKERWNLGL